MHGHVKCFDPLLVKFQLQRRVKEIYAAEEYSQKAKMFKRVYTNTYRGQRAKMIPWQFFSLAVRLELFLEDILLQ